MKMKTNVMELKHTQLECVARHREHLREDPHLRWLFFEITKRCNLQCRHCGSSCSSKGQSLTVEDINNTLRLIMIDRPMICLTGGEPLLHPAFFEIANCVHSMGFFWGMTTNATLIDDAIAANLKKTGLSTVSVSLDGLEPSHDDLRQKPGAWCCAIRGIKCLQKVGFKPQITTVVHRENIADLEPLFSILCEIGITSWRIINVEPIGRACESNDLLLTSDQFKYLLSYIRNKRFDPACDMEVTFGCSHFLGVECERMIRDHYFLCGAGILTASIRSNGDICACLDIENRQELVQGNVRKDNFMDIWRSGFKHFRIDRTENSSKCGACEERYICGGDSAHTWDYERNAPLLCYKEYQL